MPVSLNNSSPKIKKEKIKCEGCNNYKTCIRLDDKNICRPCWNKSNSKYLWCMYCEICGHLTLEDDYKTCSDCEKVVGMCCGKLYHCQSSECICKKCFNYKCVNCDNLLPNDKIYLSDNGDESAPICDTCKDK